MKLSELMAGYTPSADFEGVLTNDDNVLAIDISGASNTKPSEYVVAQLGIEGVDAQLNSSESEKSYLRQGANSTKTGTQRTFTVSGDRYIGDEFQDFLFSHKLKYGIGATCVVPYVFFNLRNGKGEQGKLSLIVTSDGGGNAGENATVGADLKQYGGTPTEYTYSAT